MPGWNENFPLFHTISEPEIQSRSEKLWKSNSDPQKRKYLLISGGIFHFLKLLTNFVTWLSIEKFVHSNFFVHDGQFQIWEKKPVCSNMCNLIWIVAADMKCADFQFFMWPKILSRFRPFFSTSLMLWWYFALQCCLNGALYREEDQIGNCMEGRISQNMSFANGNPLICFPLPRWIKSLFFADNLKQHQAKFSILDSLYKYFDQKIVCEFFWVLNDGVLIWFETQSISQYFRAKK